MGTSYMQFWGEGNYYGTTGILLDGKIGSSGIGTQKNNICSIGNSAGVVPPGLYKAKSESCSIKGKYHSSRALLLEPIKKFSNEPLYDSLFISLYLYPAHEHSEEYGFIDGQNGIAVEKNTFGAFDVGDLLEVTTKGCSELIKTCGALLPPPSKGIIRISTTDITNEFRIDFIDWGDSQEMDTAMFEYSAAIYSGTLYIDLCESSNQIDSINEAGLLCNKGNINKLGYFGTDGELPLIVKVRYAMEDAVGLWSEDTIKINITTINSPENVSEIISEDLNTNNISDLLNIMRYRKVALNYLLQSVENSSTKTECGSGYCASNGKCIHTNGNARCKCISGYYGAACQIDQTIYSSATVQNEKAASNLLLFADHSNIATAINVIAIIASNTDVVTVSTIKDIIASVEIIASSGEQIDYSTFNPIRINLVSAFIKDVRQTIGTKTRKLNELLANTTEIISQLSSLNGLLRNYIKVKYAIIAQSSAPITEDVEGQMNIYYFPAALGNVLVDGIMINATSDSIVSAMVYPQEVSMLFPLPDALSTMESNVISITTQRDGSSAPTKSLKTVTFSINAQRKLDTRGKPICGYYDETENKFSTSGCNTDTDASNSVVCSCETLNSHIYVISSTEGKTSSGTSKVNIIIAIVIPISVCVIVSVPVSVVCCLKKKANQKYKANQVKTLNTSNSLSTTKNMITLNN